MLTHLYLQHFKNFQSANLKIGPFTLLVGANATGKSNLRDAIRFLHGIGRGYNIAEIIGEKYGEAGMLQWSGIRGGSKEIAYFQEHIFSLQLSISEGAIAHDYVIHIQLDENSPKVIAERLTTAGGTEVFNASDSNWNEGNGLRQISVWMQAKDNGSYNFELFSNTAPVLHQR